MHLSRIPNTIALQRLCLVYPNGVVDDAEIHQSLGNLQAQKAFFMLLEIADPIYVDAYVRHIVCIPVELQFYRIAIIFRADNSFTEAHGIIKASIFRNPNAYDLHTVHGDILSLRK